MSSISPLPGIDNRVMQVLLRVIETAKADAVHMFGSEPGMHAYVVILELLHPKLPGYSQIYSGSLTANTMPLFGHQGFANEVAQRAAATRESHSRVDRNGQNLYGAAVIYSCYVIGVASSSNQDKTLAFAQRLGQTLSKELRRENLIIVKSKLPVA